MKAEIFCQNCRRSISNPEERGTERDGSENVDYCRYCYQAGSFTYPKLTLVEVRSFKKKQKKKLHLSYLSNGYFLNAHQEVLERKT
ncbi:MAG: zinc ribbon domain-containing protein [Chitinophagales bacterium]